MNPPRTAKIVAAKELESIKNIRPVICIDLGFAQSNPSCGVIILEENKPRKAEVMTFAEAVQEVAKVLGKVSKAVLVLEAPLSAKFGEHGNPTRRGDFEISNVWRKTKNGRKKRKATRYWYSGPGAATLLAAFFFLRRLVDALAQKSKVIEIHLVEAFLTFKPSRTAHAVDARKILAAYRQQLVAKPPLAKGNESLLSIAQMLGNGREADIPAIIAVPKTRRASGKVRTVSATL
jgi:hypothetical protein